MTAFALPDSSLDVLHAAREKGNDAWREIAQETIRIKASANGTPEVAIYQAVAVASGHGFSTIREYYRYESELGDLLSAVPQVGIQHLRLVYRAAKARSISARQLLIELAEDADEHGGLFKPVDNLAAEIRTGRVRPEQPAHALECAVRNLTTALKHAEAKQLYGMVHKIKESLWAAQAALEKLESR